MAKLQSLRGQIYDLLLDRIKTGYYPNEEKLNEEALMEEFGISRTPIREAFIQLAANGFLENRSRKGFYVKTISLQEVNENYGIVARLDAYAAELAFDNLTRNDYAEMQSCIDSMNVSIEAGDYNAYDAAQAEFHSIYLKKCGNRQLIELVQSLNSKFVSTVVLYPDQANLKQHCLEYNKQHLDILTQFRDGTVESAVDAVFRHWSVDI